MNRNLTGNAFAGTGILTRLALRRDRISLPAWILTLAALLAGFTAMAVSALPTDQDVIQETELMAGNPALRLLGLASGASVGGYTMIRSYLTLAVLAALMSLLAVTRHTRQNEESGRTELVGAAVVGRYADLTAALLVTVGANLALVPLLALAMMVNGQPVAGSVTAGVSIAAVGIVFAAVAAITAQLSASTRTANALAGSALGCAGLIGGVGNMLGRVDGSRMRVLSAWPAWLSPIGWGQQLRAFDGDNWWLLVPFATLFAILLVIAGRLATRRDLGRGVLPEHRGRAQAAPGLPSPFGLIWRLQRPTFLGWAVGLSAVGLLFGAISQEMTHLDGAAAGWYTRMGGTDRIADAYRTSILEMAGMATAVYVVQVLVRCAAQETEGPLESVLSTAVGRFAWMVADLGNALLGAAGLLLIFAVSMGLAAGAVLGDTTGQLRVLLPASLVQGPGILVLAGVVIAATGLRPRWGAALSWSALTLSILLDPLFAGALDVPGWVPDLSPFTHLPKVPAVPVSSGVLVTLAALVVLAVALSTAGLYCFQRRNLALPA